MFMKTILALFVVFFASIVQADPGVAPFLVASDPNRSCYSLSSEGNCYYDIIATETALITTGGTGAVFFLSTDAVGAGNSYTVYTVVSPNPTSANAAIFFGCSGLTDNFCVVPPGQYWIEFGSVTVGYLRAVGVK